MLNFHEIYKIYKETGLYNFTIECLNSDNPYEQKMAMEILAKQKFDNADDVKMFVAMNI